MTWMMVGLHYVKWYIPKITEESQHVVASAGIAPGTGGLT